MEAFICKLDPELNITLKIYLFKNVKNVEVIRKNIIEGSWRCAVVKPSLVVHPLQLAAAANKAALAEQSNTMVTKTVYAEILYNLSLTKNISQSLTKFGIEKDKNILVCFLVTQANDDSETILPLIDGDAVPIQELEKLTNIKDVKSAYKLNSIKSDFDLLDIILSRMATKNFVSC